MNAAALWFLEHGVGVFPLKPSSKEPACQSWDDYVATPAHASRLRNYGVRLGCCRRGCLAVVDSDNPPTEAWVAAHLPATPFLVQTARGWHRYYLLAAPVRPPFIKRDGLTVECRNQGEYVVGPGSTHPSGSVYIPQKWSWQWADIPELPQSFVWDDGTVGRGSLGGGGFELPDAVFDGERHYVLFRFIRSLKGLGMDRSEVRDVVTQANRTRCRPPLREDHIFDRWFERAWRLPDRPFGIPDLPLETGRPAIDVDTPNLEAL